MKSYLSLIPISAKVHRRQNRMTLLCIVFAVFMVTAVFSMAEMGFRMEQARLVGKHGGFSIGDLLGSSMGQTLLSVAVVLFLLILVAGVLMISSSMNSSVAQRTKFFGMMRCIGMSKQQIIRFVRLEALNWCKTAVPIGLILGVVTTWGLCAVLRFVVREEFSDKVAQTDSTETALSIVREQLTELQLQQDKICEYLEKGIYTIEMFTKRNDTLTREIHKVQAAENELLKKQGAQKDIHDVEKEIIPTTQHILDSYPQLSVEEKNRLWKIVMERITAYRTPGGEVSIHIYPKLPMR